MKVATIPRLDCSDIKPPWGESINSIQASTIVNSIAKLRSQDILPEIGGETLERLCIALKCTPGDLIQNYG